MLRYTRRDMSYLVLVRHGESRWNVGNRFTGWVDVPLTAKGIREAIRCSMHCRAYDFDVAFTSNLERAQSTLLIILSLQNRTGIFQHEGQGPHYRWSCRSNRCLPNDIPIFESELLNERFYGKLQGMDKRTAERRYGKAKVFKWRRGYRDRPPGGESLKQAFERTRPYLTRRILSRVKHGNTVLLVGHGNTLRATIKMLERISDRDIASIDLPEGRPIVYRYRAGAFVRIKGAYRFDRPLR